MQTEKELNQYGVKLVARDGTRVDCVCACGTPFSTTFCNFLRVKGCNACRHAASNAAKLQWRRDHYVPHPRKSSQAKNEDEFTFELLDPVAMWRRICDRHWKRESDISSIAMQRKNTE